MVKFERRYYVDIFNTGNFTMIDEPAESLITEEEAQKREAYLQEIGRQKFETSKARFYERDEDARHFVAYVFYK